MVTNDLAFDGHIIPSEDSEYNLGSVEKKWNKIYAVSSIVGNLTPNRVVVVGPSGELSDSSNLMFNGLILDLAGEFRVATDKFTVNTSGDTSIAGTLDILKATKAQAGLEVSGGALVVTGQAISQTGDSQVAFSGNVDASSGIDVSGGPLTIASQAITQTTGGQVTFAGNIDAQNGIDVTTGNFNVGVSKFTVIPATGNTSVAGSLEVAEGVNLATASGNVGIGTTAPSSFLDLEKTGVAKNNLDILEITNTVNAVDMDKTETSILFNQFYYDASTPQIADVGRISLGTESDWTSTVTTQDSYLTLETALDGAVSEKVRIDSAGNVGIGTTAPSYGLDVVSTYGAAIGISASADAMVVDAVGNVGIGTSSPSSELEVVGTIESVEVKLTGGTLAAGQVLVSNEEGVGAWTDLSADGDIGPWDLNDPNLYPDEVTYNVAIGATDAGSAKLYVNGNVGVGTNSPDSKVEVVGTVEMTGFKLTGAGIVADLILVSQADGTGIWTDLSSSGSVGPWDLYGNSLVPDETTYNVAIGAVDAGSAKLYVNGNTGIGTTAPAGKLEVAQNIAGSAMVRYAQQIDMDMTTTDQTSDMIGLDINLDTTGDGIGLTGAAGIDAIGLNIDVSGVDLESSASKYAAIFQGGSVGIGTVSPVGKLDIRGDEVRIWTGSGTNTNALSSGDLYVEGDLEVDGSVWLGDAVADNLTVTGQMTIDNLSFEGDFLPKEADSHDLGSPSAEWRSLYLGNVGKIYLGIAQDVNLYRSDQDILKTDDNLLVGGTLGVTGAVNLINSLSVNANTLFVNSTTSRIGIGTSSPDAKLEVVGTMHAREDVGFDANLTVAGSATIDGGLTMDMNKFTVADSTGNTTIAGTLTVNDAVDFTKGLDVTNDNFTVGGSKFTVAQATGNILSEGTLNVSGASNLAITSGSVGIGTNAPDSKLEVIGTVEMTGLKLTNSPAEGFVLVTDNAGIGTWRDLSSNGDIGPWDLDSGEINLYPDETTYNVAIGAQDAGSAKLYVNGNVGIGTTTPSAGLDTVLTFVSTEATTQIGNEFNITDTGVVTGGTDTTTGLDLNITRSGATGGTINTIGLDIYGTSNDAGDGISNLTGLKVNVTGADTNYAAIFQSGCVGIGTNTPTAELDVSGDIRATGIYYGDLAQGTVTPSGFTQGSAVFAGASGTLAQDNDNFFWDDTNKRLGIGNKTPANKLDVSGTARITEAVILGSTVNITGNVDVGSGLDVSGGPLTVANQAITQVTGGQVTFAGNVDANSGLDVVGANLTIDSNDLIMNTDKFIVDGATGNIISVGDLALNGGDLTSTGALNVTSTGGAMTLTPKVGNNLNIALSTTGDLAVNTNDLYVDTSSGFVGIGTTSPFSALDVTGKITTTELKLTDSNVSGYVLVAENDGTANWTDLSSDGNIGPWDLTNPNLYPDETTYNVAIGAQDAGSAKLYVNGNVGIGTTIPSAGLDTVLISASTEAAAQIGNEFNITNEGVVTEGTDTTTGLDLNIARTGATGGTINTIGLDIYGRGDTGGVSTLTGLKIDVASADANYAAIFQGGCVGIGTSSPVHTLEVSGTLDASGATTLGSTLTTSGNILPSLDSIHDLGSDAVRWANVYADKIVSGTTEITGNLDMNNNLILNVGAAGTDFTSGGGLILAGNVDANSGLDVAGANLTLDSNDLIVNTNKFIVDGETGNTSVAGTLGVTGVTALSSTLTVAGNVDANSGLDVVGANLTIDSNDLIMNTDKFIVDGATGNIISVGDLALNGGDLTSTGALNVTSTGGAMTLTPKVGNNLNIALSTTGDLVVNTNDFYVDTSSGFVGIGTTAPSAGLDTVLTFASTEATTQVGNEFNITDTGVVTEGTDITTGLDLNIIRTGATGGTINTIGLDISGTGDLAGDGTSNLIGLKVNVTGADTNYAAIFQSGCVGIGTNTPTAELDVSGDIRATGIYYGDLAQGTVTPSGFTQGSVVFAGATGTLAQDNDNFFWDGTNNRLGIGNKTPANKLDVSGTVSMSGFKLTTAPGDGHVLVSNDDGVGVWTDVTGNAGPWDLSSLNLYPDETTYNVAIGSISAGSAKLYVNGNVGLGISSPTHGLDVVSSSGAAFGISSSADAMLIDAAGNVGIGTTNVIRPLTVAGIIKSTTGGFEFPNGDVMTSATVSIDHEDRLFCPFTDYMEASGTWGNAVVKNWYYRQATRVRNLIEVQGGALASGEPPQYVMDVAFQIPQGFSGWGTNAVQLDFNTDTTAITGDTVTYIKLEALQNGTSLVQSTNSTHIPSGGASSDFGQVTLSGTALNSESALTTGGNIVVFRVTVYCANSAGNTKKARVSDLVLKYITG